MSVPTKRKRKAVLRCGDYPLDEVVSALQKEIRRGSQEHAFYWASTMVEFGYEDYMWRRIMVILGEDIGHHDRTVAPFVLAMCQANAIATANSKEKPKTDTNFLANAIIAMCQAVKTREGCELDEYVGYCKLHGLKLEIPSYAVDMHTKRGSQEGHLRENDGEKGNAFFEKEGRKLHPEAPVKGTYKKYRDACAIRWGLSPKVQTKDDLTDRNDLVDPKPTEH